MNPKTVLVALASAAFAAGLTYWVVSPIRSGMAGVSAQAKVAAAPAGPPLVISTAGPDSTATPAPVRSEPAPVSAASARPVAPSEKPSPIGAPVSSSPAPEKVEEPVITTAAPPPSIPEAQAPPLVQPEIVAPPPPSAQVKRPAPQTRVALSPPKEVDRGIEPAVLRENESRTPNTTTIAEGTMVSVRLGETLSVKKNLTGDTFFATLDQPLVAGGFVIAEKGARVEGKIIEVDKAGRMAGSARLSLELTQINTTDGQRVHLQTSTYTKDGADQNRKDDTAAKVGGGAIVGAVIGAAAGGGKGAAIGAGAGAAAGTGAVLLSGNRNLTIPVETKLSFRVKAPITITERVMQ